MRRVHIDEHPDGTVTVIVNDEAPVPLPVSMDDLFAGLASVMPAAPEPDVSPQEPPA